MKLKQKIVIPILIVFLLVLTTFTYIYYSLNVKLDRIQDVEDKLKEIEIAIGDIYSNAKSGILSQDPEYMIIMANESLEVLDYISASEEFVPEEMAELRNSYIETFAKIVSVNSLFLENRIEEGTQVLKEIEEDYFEIRNYLQTIIDINEQQHKAAINYINIFVLISGVLFLGVIVLIVGIIMPKHILKPVNAIKFGIKEIADGEGDLTKKINIESKDEIGELASEFNRFMDVQAHLIRNIRDKSVLIDNSSNELEVSSSQIAATSDEVAKTIDEIAKGATDQARDTELGVDNIVELGNIITENQEKIIGLTEASKKVDNLKNDGMEILLDLVNKSNKNHEAAKKVSANIKDTAKSVEKIEKVSQMIQGIADQTNLLALNASIEAARAGESGRGFAVVADEIRKLAEQSNQFANEIVLVIKEIIGKTEATVTMMGEVSQIVEDQIQSVNKTNHKFEGIAESIEKMESIIENLNSSSMVMLEKKEKMISVMENLAAISEENAAGSEEVAASVEEQNSSIQKIAEASERTSKIAEELSELVARFKV